MPAAAVTYGIFPGLSPIVQSSRPSRRRSHPPGPGSSFSPSGRRFRISSAESTPARFAIPSAGGKSEMAHGWPGEPGQRRAAAGRRPRCCDSG